MVPASIKTVGGDRFFSPDQPLVPGQEYVLRYEGQCFDRTTGRIYEPSSPAELVFGAQPPEKIPRQAFRAVATR